MRCHYYKTTIRRVVRQASEDVLQRRRVRFLALQCTAIRSAPGVAKYPSTRHLYVYTRIYQYGERERERPI